MNTKSFPFENYSLQTDFRSCTGKITLSVFETQLRSWVPFFVYLPPNWNPDESYPLVLFLHGQGGDETTFGKYIQAQQLNEWILCGELEPVVIAGVRGDNDRENVQWFTPENESMFIEEKGAEFVKHCQQTFKAGIGKNSISIEGHSRGAAGAIHFYLSYPGRFSSVIGMGYVSDYTLVDNYALVRQNSDELKKYSIPFHFEIGTEDSFVRLKHRRCSFDLHQFLKDNDIAHTFDVLHGVEHGFDTFWNYYTDEGILNGLTHLKFHEKSRK